MSQYGDGDYASVWSDRWLTARKTHECAACEIPIEPGHRYHKTFYVYDGNPNEVKRCVRCETIFEHLSRRMRNEADAFDQWDNYKRAERDLQAALEKARGGR